MKKITAVLVLALLASAAFAQQNDAKKETKKQKNAAFTAASGTAASVFKVQPMKSKIEPVEEVVKQDLTAKVAAAKITTADYCAFCGKQITQEGQMCSDRGNTVPCQSSDAPVINNAEGEECPHCADSKAVEEYLKTLKKQNAALPKCAYCGGEISAGKHCEALGYTHLCTTDSIKPVVYNGYSYGGSGCNHCGK